MVRPVNSDSNNVFSHFRDVVYGVQNRDNHSRAVSLLLFTAHWPSLTINDT